MGKTFNTGYLQNIIQYDVSNNIILPSLIGTGTRIVVAAANGTLSSQTASTTNIAEGTNLYYTDTRVGTYLSTNTYATQSYVTTAIANLVDASPATLDTLNELAAALGDDPNFATTVATSIGTKQAQLNGTGFVKVSGTTVSYDNSTYLTTSSASSTYVPYTGASADLVLGANNFSSKRVSVLKSSDGYGGFTSNYLFLQTGSSTTNVGTDGISLFSKPNQRALSINYDIAGVNYSATLDANLLNASRTFEFPNASGILALTSNIPTLSSLGGQTALSGTGFVKISGTTISYDNSTYLTTASATSTYLPLAGGTLTGALSGTSATFSGKITSTANGEIFNNTSAAANSVFQQFTNTSGNAVFGIEGSGAGGTFTGTSAYATIIGNNVSKSLQLVTNGTVRLTIDSAGAATFSNSIDVTTSGSFGFQDYRTQATQKVLVLRGEGVSAQYAPSLFNIYTKPGTTANGVASIIIKSKYSSDAESGNIFELKGDGQFVAGGLITGQASIHQSDAGGLIASNRFSVYNGGATTMRFLYNASGDVIFDNGTPRLTLSSGGTALFNVNASSSITLTSAGTDASMLKAGPGDELYLGGNDTWQMRLSGGNILMDNGGNVGINTGSPSARLDINGDVRYRGGIYDQFSFAATGNYTNGTYYNIIGVSAIATGIYILQGEIDTYAVGGGIYFMRFVSVPFYMWDVGSNSVTFVDLPPVLGTGHHLGNAFPLFRLQMTGGGTGIFLQFNPNVTWAGLDNVSGGKSFRVNLKRIG